MQNLRLFFGNSIVECRVAGIWVLVNQIKSDRLVGSFTTSSIIFSAGSNDPLLKAIHKKCGPFFSKNHH